MGCLNVLIGGLGSSMSLSMFNSLDTLFRYDVFHKYFGFFVGYRHLSLHSKLGLSLYLQALINFMNRRELTLEQFEYLCKYAFCGYLKKRTGKLLKELTLKDVDGLYGNFEKEIVDFLYEEVKIKRSDDSSGFKYRFNKKVLKKMLKKFIVSRLKKDTVES